MPEPTKDVPWPAEYAVGMEFDMHSPIDGLTRTFRVIEISDDHERISVEEVNAHT